jgi:hypothetical protein
MKLSELWESWRTEQKINKVPIAKIGNLGSETAPLYVSLTTYDKRIHKVHVVIRSLLLQDRLPEKILLWVNENLKNNLPKQLIELQSDRFEIRLTSLFCSHKKLVETLKIYPNKVLVTCDDDYIYPPSFIENLWNEHLESPESIIANVCRQIMRDDSGNLLPYKKWKRLKQPEESIYPILPLGYAGILYPPGSLNDQVFNAKLFLDLAPNADDLWFRAMAWLKATHIKQCKQPTEDLIPIIFFDKNSLSNINIKEDFNRDQWQKICNHFHI